jgi:DNA helicase-2/ATP-dependent DNA helicase PcrA
LNFRISILFRISNFEFLDKMILTNLNPPQQEAVKQTEGPLLILAGAGSGKTRVLTHRIAYILKQKLAYPNEILAVTFTNKAAGEMKERVSQLIANSKQQIASSLKPLAYGPPFIGTFHSICVKILRRDGHQFSISPNFSIYDEDDQITAVREAMKELHLNTKEFNPKAILTYISGAKNELITPDDYRQFAKGHFQSAVAITYPKYQEILAGHNALDFDDLIMRTDQMFLARPEVLKKYQGLFKYVLVDEYQDTNHAQYVFVNLIAKANRNICVVGDDDQAIYSWRGATIKNILSFEKDYPETKVIKLEQNYRSTKKILEAAFEVIRHNRSRKAKKLWTEKEAGKPIQIYTASDEKDESKFVSERVNELINDGTDLNEIAVLYRTNAQSRTLEEALLSYGIPYRIFGGTNFYQRKEIKDILAYLRVIYNTDDDLSLRRIINTPPRKIGAKTINDLEKLAKDNKLSLFDLLQGLTKEDNEKGRTISEPVIAFAKLLKQIAKASEELNITQLIQFILEKIEYLEWLDDGSEENLARIENIKELLTVAQKYSDLEPQTSLAEFLNEVSLIEEQQLKARRDQDKNSLTLMTLHSAKGLEFKHIFIVGMEEGLFPHSRSYTDPEEMEEERRLAYVGITRAKGNLYLIHAETRKYFGTTQNNLVSRFIEDIPEELVEHTIWNEDRKSLEKDTDRLDRLDHLDRLDLSEGDRVEHPQFGIGVVLEVKGDIVKIDFGPIEGVKQLAIEFAKLELVEEGY